jgi:L-2-hydroxyglutarate oxidase LhgO
MRLTCGPTASEKATPFQDDDEMDEVDCVVVGAGVIGLAIARRLAADGREVIVLESEGEIGTVTSSRNSEVIHAGIYYPRDSLMARFCVSGRAALYRYCDEHGVPHRNCGKLIVATTTEEAERLAAIAERARANGVGDMKILGRAETLALEPALNCTGALLSPSTGIIDSHAYMLALRGDAEDGGAVFAFHAPLQRATSVGGRMVLDVGGEAPMTLGCRLLVNAAGHNAPTLAAAIEAIPAERIPKAYLAKGNYFSCAARVPFSRLIYPVPVAGGLGVHLTLDMAGLARFGPDVEWIDRMDYAVDPKRSDLFYPAIRRYWPGLPDGSLVPAYSGIRPKIVPPAIAAQDFMIQGPHAHGVAGLINLFGIESPGLTSSLAIADYVAELAAT